jgi:hypothetical protein
MTVATPSPIFIVGADRSGTTLLRLMLNAHPDVGIPRESWFLTDLMEAVSPLDPLDGRDLRRCIEIVTSHPRFSEWSTTADELRSASLSVAHFESLAAFVELVFRLEVGDTRIWGDKTPEYAHYIAPLAAAFPQSRFIQIVRDGRDVGLSLLPVGWRGKTSYEVARYWSDTVRAADRSGSSLCSDRYLRIRYEDLVTDTKTVVESVSAYLGIAPLPEMYEFHDSATEQIAESERKLGIHTKLFRPPEASDVARWRQVPNEDRRTVSSIEALIQSDLSVYDYPLSLGAVEAFMLRCLTHLRRGLRYVRRLSPYKRCRDHIRVSISRARRLVGW